jgi:UDP-N-acetylmuramyl tripeptide synthase
VFGIWIGKMALLILRRLHRNATSFPGKLALRVSPKLLKKLGKQLDRCIVVTGTNGKTTTSALIAAILETESPIIHNAEGANLPQGLASALLRHTSWFGRLKRKLALLEIDEATLPLVAADFPINIAIVTNVFRDQLDRYGELDTTLQKIVSGLEQTRATVLLNADDPLARHIGLHYSGQVRYFGMDESSYPLSARDQMRDGAFCLECGTELSYKGFFYGQLGVYQCPNCDFFRPEPDFTGVPGKGSLKFLEAGIPDVTYSPPVSGMFNIYNVLAAISAARVWGVDATHIGQGFGQFKAPLGRMQGFATWPPSILNLIKNPTGCDSVLQAILSEPGEKILCIAINDLAADGRDVSWLWDADFELVAESGQAVKCIATGLRAEDMALRLKYAGYPSEDVLTVVELDAGLNEAFRTSIEENDLPVYVISTYTALYPLAGHLQRRVTDNGKPSANRASIS